MIAMDEQTLKHELNELEICRCAWCRKQIDPNSPEAISGYDIREIFCIKCWLDGRYEDIDTIREIVDDIDYFDEKIQKKLSKLLKSIPHINPDLTRGIKKDLEWKLENVQSEMYQLEQELAGLEHMENELEDALSMIRKLEGINVISNNDEPK